MYSVMWCCVCRSDPKPKLYEQTCLPGEVKISMVLQKLKCGLY